MREEICRKQRKVKGVDGERSEGQEEEAVE